MHKILFICHGNICRSPMAECVMKYLVKQNGKEADYVIESAATSTEELGNSIHYGTREILRQKGVPLCEHYAVQMKRSDYDAYDLLIGMDALNMRNILRITGGDPEGKVYNLLSFAGENRDIADPWYYGNFAKTYEDVVKGCNALFDHLEKRV